MRSVLKLIRLWGRPPKFGSKLLETLHSDTDSRCIFLAKWSEAICIGWSDSPSRPEYTSVCQDLPSTMLVLDFHQLLALSQVKEPGRDGGAEPDRRLADACVQAMGPKGDGFVAVRGMRNYASLRTRLLRLAQKLALMPAAERAAVLKEHELGTDVSLKDPGRSVSSFAAQLRFGEFKQSDDCGGLKTHWSSGEDSLGELGSLFKQLGMCMVEVGLLVARLCDAARSHGSMREATLEQAILESGTAKGRLIHYHSFLEQEVISSLRKDFRKGQRQNKSGGGEKKPEITDSVPTWWQQWHRDYGIFTVVTSPLFLRPNAVAERINCCLKDVTMRIALHNLELPKLNSCQEGKMVEKPRLSSPRSHLNSSVQECSPPDGHSSLVIMDSHGRTTSLMIPPDYLIIQVGEAAQVLCGGELVARAHCVMRPTSAKDVSRDTMAVFLQPAWHRCMSLPPGVPQELALEPGGVATNLDTHIPLLTSRWRDGCTFAELSKETTRQYYGADGYQARR